jgi:signal transduction histidine kinase
MMTTAGAYEAYSKTASVFDFLIFLAYFAIPAQLYWYLKDLPQSKAVLRIRLHFILFIVCCGLSHLFAAFSDSGLFRSASLLLFGKVVTAVVSIKTAHLLSTHAAEVIWLFSRTTLLESYIDELEKANVELDGFREAAESSAKTSNNILSSVSREILDPIDAAKEAVEATLQRMTSAEHQNLLWNALGCLATLQGTVSNMLVYVHLVQQRVTMNRRPCQISWIVEQAMNISTLGLTVKDLSGIIPCMEISPCAPVVAITDERLLVMALRCVVENAIKYTESGHVVLRVFTRERVPSSANKSGPQALLQAITHEAMKKADDLRVRFLPHLSNVVSVGSSSSSAVNKLESVPLLPDAVGQPEASGSNSRIALGEGSTELVFQVIDTGRGIPDEIKSKIFEEYVRTTDAKPEAPRKTNQGLGLGLAVCAKIMQHLGGRIEVSDNTFLGSCHGSVFELLLPDSAFVPQTGSYPYLLRDDMLPTSAHADVRVIIATEDPIFQSSVENLLRHQGVTTISLCNRTDSWISQNMDGSIAFLAPDVLTDIGWSNKWSEWKFAKEGRGIVAVVSAERSVGSSSKGVLGDGAFPLSLVAASCCLMQLPVNPNSLARVLSEAAVEKSGPSRRTSVAGECARGIEATPGSHSIRILIADDSRTGLNVVGSMIRRFVEHPDVMDAENGLEALNCYKLACQRGMPYHLILMDLNMPLMGGVAATEQIRKLPGGDEPLIAAMSSNFVTPTYHNYLKDQGFDAVITKPLTMGTLQNVVSGATKRMHSK